MQIVGLIALIRSISWLLPGKCISGIRLSTSLPGNKHAVTSVSTFKYTGILFDAQCKLLTVVAIVYTVPPFQFLTSYYFPA